VTPESSGHLAIDEGCNTLFPGGRLAFRFVDCRVLLHRGADRLGYGGRIEFRFRRQTQVVVRPGSLNFLSRTISDLPRPLSYGGLGRCRHLLNRLFERFTV
jgi:hypothetical protein